MNNLSVCVIGAGCSGLAAIKNLIQAGVQQVVCFEQGDQVGGNWVYTAEESHSSICETTHIISSKGLSEFLDFPMPTHYPDYPSHKQILAYFQAYAKHFDLEKHIRFNTKVNKVEELPDKRWKIRLDSGEEHFFDYLLTANGHHSVPRWPDLPGEFSGTYLHAHQFKNNQDLVDQRVLIIGAGNSGCDCAVEASRVAQKVSISIRRPIYIIPKFFLGKPTDTFNKSLLWIPKFIQPLLRKIAVKVQVGSYEDYGLEQPGFPVTKSHPTLNSELLYRIRHGKVTPRRAIEKVEGDTVYFADGKAEAYDIIIAASGYKIAFPFFDDSFINFEEADRIPLYLRMMHAKYPTLFFIGMTQPQGCVWPLSDLQAKLAANCIMGRWAIPQNIEALVEKECDEIAENFIKAKRHSLEVHFHPFHRKINRQIPATAPEWSVVVPS